MFFVYFKSLLTFLAIKNLPMNTDLLKKQDMLTGFNSNQSIYKFPEFSFLEFMSNWKDFFTPERLALFEAGEINQAFEPHLQSGLFSEDVQNSFNLIRIEEDNVNIYIRPNDSANISRKCQVELTEETFSFLVNGSMEKKNLNPKILKLPGITKEHLKEYKKNGCFELNGVFYSNEDCVIRTQINKNVLILDCGHPGDVPSFSQDAFLRFLLDSKDFELTFVVHMSAPEIVGHQEYLSLLDIFTWQFPEAEHVYLHPHFVSNDLFLHESTGLFKDLDSNFSFTQMDGGFNQKSVKRI